MAAAKPVFLWPGSVIVAMMHRSPGTVFARSCSHGAGLVLAVIYPWPSIARYASPFSHRWFGRCFA
jgi:hypothetical protein